MKLNPNYYISQYKTFNYWRNTYDKKTNCHLVHLCSIFNLL